MPRVLELQRLVPRNDKRVGETPTRSRIYYVDPLLPSSPILAFCEDKHRYGADGHDGPEHEKKRVIHRPAFLLNRSMASVSLGSAHPVP